MARTSTGFSIGRFEFEPGEAAYGLVVDELAHPLERLGLSIRSQQQLFERWDETLDALESLAAAIRGGERAYGPGVAVERLRAHSPVQPRQLFQSGANYRTHVIELRVAKGLELDPSADVEALREAAARMMDERAANDQPYAFAGLPSAIVGPYDDVVLPPYGEQHDWELELAVVIGRPAYRVDAGQALSHIAGYTICNDLTTRDLVFRPDVPTIGTDWLLSKNAPTFFPTGPYLVPSRFVERPEALEIELRLNGETMQRSTTGDMIFGIARLIEHVSQTVPMLPGDLLLTGSPPGNGAHYGRFLREGDVMEASITGLGRQHNRCVRLE